MNDHVKDQMSERLFGRKLTESRKNKICVVCGEKLTPFRDSVSVKEYELSGMCQNCQDKTFGGGE